MFRLEPTVMAKTVAKPLVLPEILRVGGPTLAQRIFRVLRDHPDRLRKIFPESAQYLRFYRVLTGSGGQKGYQAMLNGEDVVYFCRMFNVSPFWLLFGVGEPYDGRREYAFGEKNARFPGYRPLKRAMRRREVEAREG